MGRDNHDFLALKEFLSKIRGIQAPKGGKFLNGADVDLYEEKDYLVGLATSFLNEAEISLITTNSQIDIRLMNAKPTSDSEQHALDQFREHRTLVLKLAELLSKASGVRITSQ